MTNDQAENQAAEEVVADEVVADEVEETQEAEEVKEAQEESENQAQQDNDLSQTESKEADETDEEVAEASETKEEVAETEKTDDENLEPPETQEVEVDNPNLITVSDAENRKAHWYVVHTYSGRENKVAETLKQRAETLNLTDKILNILIPTKEKIQIRRGKRKTVNEKIFPGYMLVQMEMTDDSWLAVRTTQGVTGFVGTTSKPSPLPLHEVEAIQKYMTQATPQYKAEFREGEAVKITDGPFTEFLGTVQSINEEKGQVEVLINIFGRETPVELDFLQVEKV
ncbi:MAG: transcription termination/antitermination factor NusG [Candidatus Pacebacteria bacterium]|nr:transcription termination/antitermination factor NusG [Candidatus Paceibacterota bacterium]